MSEIPIPKTVDELKTAIDSIFEPIGTSTRAWEFVGHQRATMVTYVAGKSVEEGADRLEYYFPVPEAAIAKTWEEIHRLRYDAACCVTKEEVEDGMPFRFLPSRVIWRSPPQLLTNDNGICTVRLRAAFI